VPRLTVVHVTPYMTGRTRDPSVPSVLSPWSCAAGPLGTVAIRHEDAVDAADMVPRRRPGSVISCHPQPSIWVAERLQNEVGAEGLAGEIPANEW